MRYWSGENPRELHQKPLHCERVTVWCAISVMGIIGPYFFEENKRAVTVDAARYPGHDRGIFSSKPQRNGHRRRVVSAGRSHSTYSTRLNGFVEIPFLPPPHLSQRRSPMAGTLSRFDSMRFFFFMGLFEIPGLCRSTTDRNSPQEQHSRRHYQPINKSDFIPYWCIFKHVPGTVTTAPAME